MGKVGKFLEQYVQWLALALGAAYMLYMAYSYLGCEVKLAEPPLSLKINNVVVPPGEVDKTTVKLGVEPLEAAIKVTKDEITQVDPATSTFTIARPDELGKPTAIKFKVTRETAIRASTLGINWVRVQTLLEQNTTKRTPEELAYLEKAKAAALHFDDLKVGALVHVEISTGVQTSGGVIIPALSVTLESPIVENVQVDYDKRLDEQKADLTAVALNTSGAYQAPGISGLDIPKDDHHIGGIVTLPIPPAAMPGPYYTHWTVTMMGPPDAAGKPTRQDTPVIAGTFTINSDALTKEMTRAYKDVPNQAPNLQDPQFCRVYLLREEQVNGTWSAPKVIAPLSINKLEPYPSDAPDFNKLGPDIAKKNWFVYKNWMEQKDNQSLILDPPFYPEPADVTKTTRPSTAPAVAPQPGAGAGKPPAVPPALPPAANPAQVPPVINGGPAAAVVNKDREIVFYDTTVEEGKTYRYAVRYRLLNAVFDHKQEKAEPKNIDEIFEVRSYPDPANDVEPKVSEDQVAKLWTEPIMVEPTSQIFVTRVNQAGSQFGPWAQFFVFIWKDGHWKQFSSQQVFPGDPVNAPAGAGRTSTGWSVVDIRKDPHAANAGPKGQDSYVLIMDDHGIVTSRDVQTDAADKEFIKLKGIAAGPATALRP